MIPVPGLDLLWHETLGDPGVTVAILDGPVDVGHPSLAGARLVAMPTLASAVVDQGPASRHGTHVASVVFGQHDGPVRGVAPGCRGLLLPIFASQNESSFVPCNQLDLARAITQALGAGAQIINISGGEFTPGGQAHPLLANVVKECARRGVLIVAATGNDGCACLHVPAALDSVLAVGAMDAQGEPLPSSNWGGAYQQQGIVAPGLDVLGAVPGGGTAKLTGTSFAAPLVSGVVALLLSMQMRRGLRPDPLGVRKALLQSAVDCRAQLAWDCPRLLVGRLNLPGAIKLLFKEPASMSLANENESAAPQSVSPLHAAPTSTVSPASASAGLNPSGHVQPSACGCGGGPRQLVYALGQLDYDFISEARHDSLVQRMAKGGFEEMRKSNPSSRAKLTLDAKAPSDQSAFLDHLDKNPTDAANVEWTLWLDGTPIYAIRPQSPFSEVKYQELRAFLRAQLNEEEKVERISVPGVISGQARLLSGQVVPVISPDVGGIHSWSTDRLVKEVVPALGRSPSQAAIEAYDRKVMGIANFLQKIYHGLRNLGVLPQDRALNYVATNCFNFQAIYAEAVDSPDDEHIMELDSVSVVPSPFCRPGSDCWDVEIYFFYPARQVQTVRKVYRFTVDVSDIVPVTIGPTRSWFTR